MTVRVQCTATIGAHRCQRQRCDGNHSSVTGHSWRDVDALNHHIEEQKMATTKKRPAEELAYSIEGALQNRRRIHTEDIIGRMTDCVLVPATTLERWRKLAKSIDGRGRLDGSAQSKHRRK